MSGSTSNKAPTLRVRRMKFEFPDHVEAHWHPGRPEWSCMVNGASMAMPYLEPYLVRTMKKLLPQLSDPDLKEELKLYISQEAQHFQQHRKFNELVKRQGYEELGEIERQLAEEYKRFEEQKSLKFNVAYAAGFESMALAVGHFLIKNREFLFGGADPRVSSLVLWHFVEEIEHKNSAFDAYQSAYGDYWYRVYMTLFSALHLMKASRRAYIVMMKKDGLWSQLRRRLNVIRYNLKFLKGIAPVLFHSLLPGHHPSDIPDPQWCRDWVHRYEADEETAVYLDTDRLATPVMVGGKP